MATVKFPSEMPSAADVGGNDKLMISKDGSGEAFQVTFNNVKEYLEITDIELEPVQGGATEAEATPLPSAPAGQNRKMDASPGWYSVGGNTVEATAGHVWKWFWNGTTNTWSLVDMGELPIAEIDKTNTISERTEKVTTEEAVLDYSLPHNSTRIFPQGWEVDVIDRPDMKSLYPTDNNPGNIPVLDQLGNINHFIKTTSAPGDEIEFDVIEHPLYSLILVDRSNNIIFSLPRNGSGGDGGGGSETLIHGIYRPDLRKVVLDKNDNIFELEKTVENTFGYDFLTYVNPTEKPAFDIREPEYSWGINYDELIQKYDDLMDIANSNPESTIISKGIYGYSGATALPLYYYRLRATDTPKVKIALTSGTHAAEKMYIFGLYEIFKDLIESPYQHPTIQWIRDNCEVVFIPCNCPESIGFPERVNGTRTTPETRPFTASYSSDGSIITITYTQSNFPTENTGLIWDDYFQVQPDKRMITIWSTDDEIVLPRGLYEYTVVNGSTITINALTSTIKTGSAEIQVWADPNRNVDNGTGIYADAVQSNNIQLLDDGTPYALYDHKGTKAGSVQEIRNFVDFLYQEKFDISIDAHCPPRDHYMRGYRENLFHNNISLMQSIKSFSSIFNPAPFDENITVRGGTPYPGWVTEFSGLGVTIEWGSGLVNAADWQVTGAVRWAYTVMIGLLKYSVNNK